MSKADEVSEARAKWRDLKDACAKAGGKNLFGSDDLGPALDTMAKCVAIVEMGSKVPQDAKGKKALEKARGDGRAAAEKAKKAAAKYRDLAQDALGKTESKALKAALRNAVTGLNGCHKIASGVAHML